MNAKERRVDKNELNELNETEDMTSMFSSE